MGSHHSRFGNINGARARTKWGLNDLVFQLYRPLSTTYVLLHTASNEVRYERGLRVPLDDVHLGWKSFKSAVTDGGLVTER